MTESCLGARIESRLASVVQRAEEGEFSGRSVTSSPDLYCYPGTMLPALQRAVLDAVLPHGVVGTSTPKHALDPFVGSGTSLAELTLRGYAFHGVDINPLAILIASVKAGPFWSGGAYRDALGRILDRAVADASRMTQAPPGIPRRWYSHWVAIYLSRLYRAILAEPQGATRKFFWVVLAETARLSSNSRLSTAKLHLRSQDDRVAPASVLPRFERVAERSLLSFDRWKDSLRSADLIAPGGHLKPRVTLACADIRQADLRTPGPRAGFDLLVTSPPYGDNHTTVPYGQASFLPSSWICPQDFRYFTGRDIPPRPGSLDTQSLGGRRRRPDADVVAQLVKRSRSLGRTLEALASAPADRPARVARFVNDLDASLVQISAAMARRSWQVWTVGPRLVGGVRVPLGEILTELLCGYGVERVAEVSRRLPSQRRAGVRNDRGPTMTNESVLVFRTS